MITSEQLLRDTGGRALGDVGGRVVMRAVADSRQVQKGDLFAALAGSSADGHSYVDDAMRAGAQMALVSRPVGDHPQIVVGDVSKALWDMARGQRARYKGTVVGITGSMGKTSTKEMLVHLLGLRGSVAASQGNYNTEIGLPLSMVAMDGGAPYTVLEMGMRGPGQIRELAELARPKVGAVTAVALNHVGLFRSPEGVARAKAELVEALPEDGLAVLNADNRYMPLLKRFATCPTLLVGRSPKADVRLLRQQAAGREGSRMEVAFPGGQSAEIQVPWPGPGAAACALMATGLAWGLGLTPEEIARRFPSLPQGAARLKVRQVGDVTVVDDAYNAAPDSVRAALEFTAQAAGGRVVAVLGDMLELGDYSVSAHREVGRAAGKLVDLLVAVGTYAGETVGGALEIAPALPVKTYGTTDEVLEDGLQFVAPGDTVLLKASRGLHFERLVERLEEGAR